MDGDGTYLQVFSVTPDFARLLLRFCHSPATGMHRPARHVAADWPGDSTGPKGQVVADSPFDFVGVGLGCRLTGTGAIHCT